MISAPNVFAADSIAMHKNSPIVMRTQLRFSLPINGLQLDTPIKLFLLKKMVATNKKLTDCHAHAQLNLGLSYSSR